MRKYLMITVVGAALAVASTDVFAGHRRCGGGSYYAPAPAVAPGAPAAPIAAAPQGARTFSYQPAPASVDYRAYGSWISGRTEKAYENGNNKALGRGF